MPISSWKWFLCAILFGSGNFLTLVESFVQFWTPLHNLNFPKFNFIVFFSCLANVIKFEANIHITHNETEKKTHTNTKHTIWQEAKKFNSMLKRWNARMRHEHDAFWFYEYILGLDCDSKCKTPKFGSNLNEKGVKAVDIYATLQCKLNRRALRILPKREKRR